MNREARWPQARERQIPDAASADNRGMVFSQLVCAQTCGSVGNVRHFLLRNLSVTTNWLNRRSWLALPLLAAVLTPGLAGQTAQPKRATYFPAAGTWQHKRPAEWVWTPRNSRKRSSGPKLMARSGTLRKTRCAFSARYWARCPRNARQRTALFCGTAISWRSSAIRRLTIRSTASLRASSPLLPRSRSQRA